jgi:hypothetical protein
MRAAGIVGIIGGALLCGGNGAVPAAAGLLVSPRELHFRALPGGQATLTILLNNRGHLPIFLAITTADFRLNRDGALESVEAGSAPRSCAGWIRLESDRLVLASRQERTLRVSIDVPPDARGAHWAELALAEIREGTGPDSASGPSQVVRVRVFHESPPSSPGPPPRPRLEARVGEDPLLPELLVELENSGEAILRCTGRIELRDARGMVARKVLLGTEGRFVLFPGGVRRLAVLPAPPLEPGEYTAVAFVDYGGRHRVAGETRIRIPAESSSPGGSGSP